MRRMVDERPFLQRILNLGTILLVTASLLFLATTLSNAEFKRGKGLFELFDAMGALFIGQNGPAPPILPPGAWDVIRTVIFIILFIILVDLLGTRQGRKEIPGLLRRIRNGLVFIFVGSLIFRLFSIETTPQNELIIDDESAAADPPFDDATVPELAEQAETIAFEPPESLTAEVVLILIGVFILITLLMLLIYWWQYRQMLKQLAQQPVDELRVSALMALQELRQGKVPLTDVIRRCYQEMTQTVQANRGVFRQQNVTPREFEGRLIQIGLPAEPVLRLTRLFEQVRYGNEATTERQKREAIDSLEQIVAAIEESNSRRGWS